jgi:hypothetical protein
MFERLQAQAMAEAITAPFVLATLARGARSRVVWRDALKRRAARRRQAGIVVGTLLSGRSWSK